MDSPWLKSLLVGVLGGLIVQVVVAIASYFFTREPPPLDGRALLESILTVALLTLSTRYYLLTHRVGITRVRNTAKEKSGRWIGEAVRSYRWIGATAYYVLCDPHVREQYVESKTRTDFLFVTLDPQCTSTVAAQAAWEGVDERYFLDHIEDTRKTIEKLRTKIRIRGEDHFFTPTFRVIVVDNKKVLVSFYEEDKLGTECKQLQIRGNTLLGRWFIQWFDKTRSDAQRWRIEMTALSSLVTRVGLAELKESLQELGLSAEDRVIADELIAELGLRLRTSGAQSSDTACLLLGVDVKNYADSLIAEWSSSNLTNMYIEASGREEGDSATSKKPLESLVDAKLSRSGTWIALLGDFGTGKTTFLRKYAASLATRFLHEPAQAPLPILVDLAQYAHIGSLERLVLEELAQRGVVVAWRFVENLLRQRKIILILDSLDQMSTSVDRDAIRRNLDRIKGFVSQHQAASLIACRTHVFGDSSEQRQLYPGTLVFVEPWDPAEQDQYLKAALGSTWARVRDAINNKHGIADLARTPLFLNMIVTTKAEVLSDTIGIASLYRIYTDRWIASEEPRSVLGPAQKSALMEVLAWRMLRDGRQAMAYTELGPVLQEQRALTPTELDRVDYDIRACSFLVRSEVLDAFVFVHYSFLEYFVSRFLAKGIRNQRIGEMCEVELSEDVIQLLAQQLDELSHYKVLHSWLEKKEDPHFAIARRNIARVLRAMSHRPHLDPTKKEDSKESGQLERMLRSSKLKRRLDAILEFGWFGSSPRLALLGKIIEQPSGKDPRELRLASIVLGLRNHRASTSALKSLLLDLEQHFKVRQNAAVALGLMTDRSGLDSLKESLSSDPHHEVRRAVCWAIEMIDPNGAVGPLASRATNDSSGEVRQYAVWALSRIGCDDSIVLTTMRAVLADPEPIVRLAAVQAIERMESDVALQLAAQAMNDRDENVSSSAERAVGRLKERLRY